MAAYCLGLTFFVSQILKFPQMKSDFAKQDRTSAMNEVKDNINGKIKSLKRRRSSDPAALRNALQSVQTTLLAIIDFYKKLQLGSAEGRSLYEGLHAIEGAHAGQEVWKRVLKAWSFEAGLGQL